VHPATGLPFEVDESAPGFDIPLDVVYCAIAAHFMVDVLAASVKAEVVDEDHISALQRLAARHGVEFVGAIDRQNQRLQSLGSCV
jgi:hypothetical protein